jgi:hypothetical protein
VQPIGSVDRVAHRTIFGWACDLDRPGEPVEVVARINGVPAGTHLADRLRQDLRAAGYGDGRHAFVLPIPDRCGDVGEVAVRVVGAVADLPHATDARADAAADLPLPDAWRPGPACAYPSFFLLGAAKCGTTSLHHYLGQHPAVCMSEPKEPFYFEAEWALGPRFYRNRYFAHWQGEQVVGDARHRNLYLPFVPDRILSHNPSARLIAILRNPVERLVSHWWHWYSRAEEALGLTDAVAADLERIGAGRRYESAAEQERYARTLDDHGKGMYRSYVDSGYYAEQLARYVARVDRTRLLVLWFEDFVRDPQAVVASALGFLGLDPADAARIHYPQMNRSDDRMRCHLDGDLTARLVAHYRPHNCALERLTGRSLAGWDDPFRPVS